jgi:integrase
MTHIYDQTTRAAVRKRRSPPKRDSVVKIATDTGITEQTLCNLRRSWQQQQGELVPVTEKPEEQWSTAAKHPIVFHPHVLRHACGFALADQGADTRLIQDYLGQRNIQHTVRYTATNPARFEKLWR